MLTDNLGIELKAAEPHGACMLQQLLQGIASGATSQPPLSHLYMCKKHLWRAMCLCQLEGLPPLCSRSDKPHWFLVPGGQMSGRERNAGAAGEGETSQGGVQSFGNGWNPALVVCVVSKVSTFNGEPLSPIWTAALFHHSEEHSQVILKLQFMLEAVI